jgi:hypothetical protein
MKKLLTLMLFAALSATTFAQSASIPVIVKGGVGISNWYGDDADGTDAKFAWKLGIGTEFSLGQNFILQPSLMFINEGTKIDGKLSMAGVAVSGSITSQEDYLQLPIMFGYRVNVDKGTNIVFTAGPYLAYGIAGKTKGEVASISTKYDTFGDDGMDMKTFDAGLGCGVTGEFNNFLIGIDGHLGLTDLQDDFKAHNLGAYLTVGYKF